MPSDDNHSSQARLSRWEGDAREQARTPHDRSQGRKDSERHRRRSRSRDRRPRRRSRTPDSSSRRPRSRDRRHRRDRDRDDDESNTHRRRHSRDGHKKLDRSSKSAQSTELNKGDNILEPMKRGGPLPSQEASFAITNGDEPEKPKEQPNYGATGLLAAETNSVARADGSTITLKYHEPPEARKASPRDQWKLFVFKGKDIVDTIDLSSRTCWLVGRDMAVVDLPAEHPSLSKQHAVIQFRYIEKRNEYGDKQGKVKPYLIDLESANGTILNNDKIPESRYLELRDKDMVQFGHSTREYVIMLAPKD